ncbi:hypothetical protein Tco_0386721 [Tanacetum coccineum]
MVVVNMLCTDGSGEKQEIFLSYVQSILMVKHTRHLKLEVYVDLLHCEVIEVCVDLLHFKVIEVCVDLLHCEVIEVCADFLHCKVIEVCVDLLHCEVIEVCVDLLHCEVIALRGDVWTDFRQKRISAKGEKISGEQSAIFRQSWERFILMSSGVIGDLSLESMEDEEVATMDGVFEGAFGALGDKTWFGGGSFGGCHGGFWWLIMDEEDDEVVGRLARIHRREVHKVLIFDFGGLPYLMAEGLTARMLMEQRDDQGVSVFTSRAWRRMLDIRGPLVHELILEFFSTFRFGKAILDLDTLGIFIVLSARQIPDKGDLRDYWIGISFAGDFLGTAPSYTAIRDPILRLCHRLIACSIAGRSQAPKKVTVMDLFYLGGMYVGSVNIPYFLAMYLRLSVAGRKSGAYISGGQFVARLAEHFRLLTTEILG